MVRNKFLIGVILAGLASAGTGVANATLPGYFVGGQLGWSDTHFGASDLRKAGNFTSASIDDSGLAGRVFTGYQLDQNYGLELGYTRFATASVTKATSSSSGNSVNGHIHEYAIDALGTASLPMGNGFSVGGGLGLAYIKTHGNSNIISNQSRFNPEIAVKAAYDVTANTNVFAGWNRIQKVGGSIPSTDLISAGIQYNFG